MSTPARDIFEDDKKLDELCMSYFHHLEELKRLSLTDPEQTPTPIKLASLLKFDGVSLTIDEYKLLQDFADNSYGDWSLARIKDTAIGYVNFDGTPVNDLEGF